LIGNLAAPLRVAPFVKKKDSFIEFLDPAYSVSDEML